MKNRKRLVAFALVLSLTALSGCGPKPSGSAGSGSASGSGSGSSDSITPMDLSQVTDPALAVAGVAGEEVLVKLGTAEITANDYLYWLQRSISDYLEPFGGQMTTLPWDTEMSDGLTFGQYMLDNALDAAALHCMLRELARQENLTPDPDVATQVDKQYAAMVVQAGSDESRVIHTLWTQMLTRDLLIRMTAPEGGAALLSGGYDSAQLDSLSQGVNPTRLIYMATQLQTTAAALPLSANRRTDAELCLMRLCDEGLCGDVTALAARLARLEEGGAAPVHPAPPRPAPVKAQAPPPQDPPPWDEDPAPIPDAPPWDEPDGPPPYGEPVRPAPAPERQRGTPPPQPQAASGGDTLWRDVAEVCKNQLTPMYWFMLDDTSGTLEGDTLTVRCGDELTKETLDTPDISAVIRTAAAGRLGRSVAVRFALGGGEAPAAADKLEDLIRQGSKYDSFTVK